MSPLSGKVILGDGKTSLEIHGIGTVKLCLGGLSLSIEHVRYVPDLAESIFSLFLHIQSPGCAVHSSFDDGLSIIFPDFQTKALIGYNNIYLDAVPSKHASVSPSILSASSMSPSCGEHQEFCRHINDFQFEIQLESKKVDHLLHQLRQYYHNVKTRCQLDLEVPAGFRHQSAHQRLLSQSFAPISAIPSPLELPDDSLDCHSVEPIDSQDSVTNSSSMLPVPILRCVDKPSSSLTFTEDFVCTSVSFRRIESIKQKFSDLYQHTISFDSLPPDAILDNGDFSTLRKTARNTQPVPLHHLVK